MFNKVSLLVKVYINYQIYVKHKQFGGISLEF